MNLKTALFIALFFSAISFTYQATADGEPEQVNVESNDPNLLEQAKAAEQRAVAELKLQAKNAKEQFKTAFNRLKALRASSAQESSSDSSDSDTIIQQAITEAETAADQAKQGEWRGVSELKAQAQRAKEAYKTAKASLKSKFAKKSSSDSSESSESSDDVRDATEGVVDRAARAAEWKIIAELKEQYNNAKRAAKVAYKKLRKQEDTSSSSSSDDGTVKEAIKDKVEEKVEERVTEAVHETVQEGKEGLLEQARTAQRAAYQELKDGAQRAKDSFWTAYGDLKNKIRTEKGQQVEESSSSSSSSDSSDSSDDSILKKARRYSEILRNRAEQVRDEALNKVDELRNREHVDNDL